MSGEISIEIQTFWLKNMPFKMSSVKWRPFCYGLNVLNHVSMRGLPRSCDSISAVHFIWVSIYFRTLAVDKIISPATIFHSDSVLVWVQPLFIHPVPVEPSDTYIHWQHRRASLFRDRTWLALSMVMAPLRGYGCQDRWDISHQRHTLLW